jgi:NMD protein affecting ribosome stability and mRNA decay
MTTSEALNNLHCCIQEFEQEGIDLPYMTYDAAYELLEILRDEYEKNGE